VERSSVTERRTSAEMARRLEDAGFRLEVAPTGKRWWREPGTERLMSGDRAAEHLCREEERALEQAGWEQVNVEGEEAYWCKPDSGHLYPQKAAHDVMRSTEERGTEEDK
jgi:predicted RNA binding protein YcfA (HicA-like mRNA interferase family)